MVMMMKISKCKKELARIISENGGWRNGEFAAQDGDGGVGGYGEKPVWSLLGQYWRNEAFGEWFMVNKIKNHHQTVLSRAEYFHLYPSPDADGWIEWKGGECPVERGTLVDVKYSGGEENFGVSALTEGWHEDHVRGSNRKRTAANWVDILPVSGIVAYRLHKPEQSTVETRLADAVDIVKAAAPALMSDEMKFTGDEVMGEIKPTLDRLLQDWRNADDFAKRKQAEADEAAEMRDERWNAVHERAGEVGVTVGLCESVAAEPEQVKPVKPVMTGKFRNAKIGSPKHYIFNNGWSGEICDECGERFGSHFDTDCDLQ